MGALPYNNTLTLIATTEKLFFHDRYTNKLTPVHLPDALIGNVAALERDDDGFIWIGTTNGLYRFHPRLRTLVLFNRLDGMSNDMFTLGASYKMKDGRLLFGTTNSFIAFNPKD